MLGVNAADSSHFKRNVESKLKTWGYGYDYARAGVTIQRRPALPEERLKELLIRKLGLDVQINPVAFALFVAAFTDIEGFASMPWGERARVLYERRGVSVDEKTLRNWFSKLIKNDIAVKSEETTYWRTDVINKVKTRSPATKEDFLAYNTRKYQVYQDQLQAIKAATQLRGKEASTEAWKQTYRLLWAEYHCCYYSCKHLIFTAFNEDADTLHELYELVTEIVSPISGTPQGFS